MGSPTGDLLKEAEELEIGKQMYLLDRSLCAYKRLEYKKIKYYSYEKDALYKNLSF